MQQMRISLRLKVDAVDVVVEELVAADDKVGKKLSMSNI
jgi:hypothetical protein